MIREINYTALSQHVLAVCVANFTKNDDGKRILFDWAVYIDAVEGLDHEREFQQVSRTGAKQGKEIGRVLFGFDIDRYRL